MFTAKIDFDCLQGFAAEAHISSKEPDNNRIACSLSSSMKMVESGLLSKKLREIVYFALDSTDIFRYL